MTARRALKPNATPGRKPERAARREGLPPPRLTRRTVGVRSVRTREADEYGSPRLHGTGAGAKPHTEQ